MTKESVGAREIESKDAAVSQTVAQRKSSHVAKQRKQPKPPPEIDWSGEVTGDDLAALSPNEIRAVATDRGYIIAPGGRRRVTSSFLACQARE